MAFWSIRIPSTSSRFRASAVCRSSGICLRKRKRSSPQASCCSLSRQGSRRPIRSFRLRRPKGAPLEVEISARRLADGRLQLALRDIAERRRAADALRESEDRYERLAAQAPDAIVIEAAGRVVLANPSLRRLLGLQPSAPIAGRALGDFVHPDERQEVARAAAEAASAGPAGVRLVTRLKRHDGSTAEVEGVATVVTYRGRPAVQFLLREVRDERPIAKGDVYRDPLTGLTSALIAPDRLSVAIAQAYRHRARVGLVHVDLDDFQALDTRLGRPVADRLLRAVARRLLHCVRQGDTAARLEQDSFALVLPGLVARGASGFITEGLFVDIGTPDDYGRLAAAPERLLAAVTA